MQPTSDAHKNGYVLASKFSSLYWDIPHGMVGEFETTIEVFYQAGEGMYGEAEIQGKWMGRFIPYIGNPQDTAVYTAEHPAG